MPELSPLPNGCTIRPAQATDMPRIQQMLKNLAREITPPAVIAWQWLWVGILGCGLLVAIGYVFGTPTLRTLLNLLVICALGVTLMMTIAAVWLQTTEWIHYWVVEYNGYLLACAKLQHQGSHSLLFDLYVAPDWRGKGVGSYLVNQLSQRATKPLYLACLPMRLAFYQRLGFVPVPPKRLPLSLQYDLGLPTRPGIIPLVLQ